MSNRRIPRAEYDTLDVVKADGGGSDWTHSQDWNDPKYDWELVTVEDSNGYLRIAMCKNTGMARTTTIGEHYNKTPEEARTCSAEERQAHARAVENVVRAVFKVANAEQNLLDARANEKDARAVAADTMQAVTKDTQP